MSEHNVRCLRRTDFGLFVYIYKGRDKELANDLRSRIHNENYTLVGSMVDGYDAHGPYWSFKVKLVSNKAIKIFQQDYHEYRDQFKSCDAAKDTWRDYPADGLSDEIE